MELSQMLSAARGCEPYFPILHQDGYAGEQDGDYVVFSSLYSARTLTVVDRIYPEGCPAWARVHWAKYNPSGLGWTWILGAWESAVPENPKWPVKFPRR